MKLEPSEEPRIIRQLSHQPFQCSRLDRPRIREITTRLFRNILYVTSVLREEVLGSGGACFPKTLPLSRASLKLSSKRGLTENLHMFDLIKPSHHNSSQLNIDTSSSSPASPPKIPVMFSSLTTFHNSPSLPDRVGSSFYYGTQCCATSLNSASPALPAPSHTASVEVFRTHLFLLLLQMS